MSNLKLILEMPIFQEAKIVHSTPGKAIFRMTMQTLGDVNLNGRMYPSDVVSGGLLDCKDRMRRRAFYSELDHPLPSGNDQVDAIRQTTVLLSEASHIIRDYEIKNNKVIGELETINTPKGGILLGLLRDKTGLGLSLRGMASLTEKNNHKVVTAPLTIIGYDAVSSPSHQSALVDFNEMRFESKLLTESNNMICIGDKCYLPNFFDKLVETRMIKFFDKWV